MIIKDAVLEKINEYPILDAPSLTDIAHNLYARANTNVHIEDNPVTSRKLSETIYDILSKRSMSSCKPPEQILKTIGSSVKSHQPIRISLLALPYRNMCAYETVGANPTLSELLELHKLTNIDATIKKVYSPGAEIYVLLEGNYLRDPWEIPQEHIEKYVSGIKDLLSIIDPQKVIKLIDLQSALDKTEYPNRYASKLEELRTEGLQEHDLDLLEPMCRAVNLDNLQIDMEQLINRPEYMHETLTSWIKTVDKIYRLIGESKQDLLGKMNDSRGNSWYLGNGDSIHLDSLEWQLARGIIDSACDMTLKYVTARDARHAVNDQIGDTLPDNIITAGVTRSDSRLSIPWIPPHRGYVSKTKDQPLNKINDYVNLWYILDYCRHNEIYRVDVDRQGVPAYWILEDLDVVLKKMAEKNGKAKEVISPDSNNEAYEQAVREMASWGGG